MPTAVLAVGFIALLINQQAVIDWVRLYGYEPPAVIRQLADDTTMTAQSRHLFYLNKPTLDAKAEFSRNCPNRREQSIVIGCYHSPQQGISVLKVDDPRLDGVEEVTAAHEMLHAAYDRLSGTERQRIDGLLSEFARSGLQDERIKKALDAYTEEERLNEMHSMFGTELAELPPELNSYYERYFSNRQQVATSAARYTGAFTGLQQQVKAYDEQLETWKRQIETTTARLADQKIALDGAQRQLEAYEQAGNIAAYNAAVPVYNRQVDTYNVGAAAARDLIARHNAMVEERNSLALEEQDLQRQLDASEVPAAQ